MTAASDLWHNQISFMYKNISLFLLLRKKKKRVLFTTLSKESNEEGASCLVSSRLLLLLWLRVQFLKYSEELVGSASPSFVTVSCTPSSAAVTSSISVAGTRAACEFEVDWKRKARTSALAHGCQVGCFVAMKIAEWTGKKERTSG